jgi:5-dehydro-2-deoxygluconokinase
VLLGLDAPIDEIKQGFNNTAGFDICKGFTIGRTLWAKESRQWLAGELDDEGLINSVSNNYLQLIQYWRERTAS